MDENRRGRRLTVVVNSAFAMLLTAFGKRQDSDRGATATEYAILVAFIALLIILGVTFFGGALNNWFGNIGNHVKRMNS